MQSLDKTLRSTARGILTFGPLYLLALAGKPGSLNTRNIRTQWGRFYFRPSNSDVAVYIQIFKQKDYSLTHFPQYPRIIKRYDDVISSGGIPVIVDAGANNGLSAVWLAMTFPKAAIIAVEPDPENVVLCRLNTGSLSNITVIEAAIGSEPGTVELSVETQAWSVQTQRSKEGSVRVVTVPELIALAGHNAKGFMCKIDIEGFESDLFASNTEWIDSQTVIIIEPHEWKPSGQGSSFTFQKALMGWGQLLLSGENLVFVK